MLFLALMMLSPVAAEEYSISGKDYGDTGFDRFMEELPEEVRDAIGGLSIRQSSRLRISGNGL